MALAYRAYFAFINRPLLNSKGVNTSAVYGFVTALMRILEDEKPEHIAVVFDTRQPTFRHTMFPSYKATRQKMPEDMASQMDKLKEVVRAFNTPLIEVPGYEADDVIGTLARRAEKEGVMTYLVTGDKDFMQLISPLIKMYKPAKAGGEVEIVDEGGVQAKFGVRPDQVIDVLGLIGDSSDNVPGVKGVGEKTAIPLIQKYGSMQELYDHINDIPQKGLREKLETSRDIALLSRDLVTIRTDVPVDVDFHTLRAARRDTTTLIKLFGELEFRSLAGKLRDTELFDDLVPASTGGIAPAVTAPGKKDISTEAHHYACVTRLEDFQALCTKLSNTKRISLVTLSTSHEIMKGALAGIAFSWKDRESWFVPVQSETAEQVENDGLFPLEKSGAKQHTVGIPLDVIIKWLKPILENGEIKKAGHDVKQDMLALQRLDIQLAGTEFDTMVGSYVLRADAQHSLSSLASEYLGYSMMSFDDVVGKGKERKEITEVPVEKLADFLGERADIALQVHALQRVRLEQAGLMKLCKEIEFALIPVLARMEFAGISLDVPYLGSMSKELERQIDGLVRSIYQDAGEQFNINSTQQLADILFKRLNLSPVRKTKTGFSTDVGVLEVLKGQHPIIEKLLEYRQYTKLKSTYIDALPQLVNPRTGRIHASFNQTVAATGRLSGSDPNLQNIPIRTELGRAIRKAFIAGSEDCVLFSADYSQIELRVMAHICGDEGLLEAFRNNEDIHSSTAAKVFGVPISALTRDMRRKAKEVNFGIMYGIGPFGLATRLEISQTEAKEIIARYFERFPKVKQYITDTIDSARRTGYVQTLTGRRRYLSEINSRNANVRGNAERQAINMPIQGTAADMIKTAMIAIDTDIMKQHLESTMLLQVHDELVFEVPLKELETMKALVLDRMQNALSLSVPIQIETGSGRNWLEAH